MKSQPKFPLVAALHAFANTNHTAGKVDAHMRFTQHRRGIIAVWCAPDTAWCEI